MVKYVIVLQRPVTVVIEIHANLGIMNREMLVTIPHAKVASVSSLLSFFFRNEFCFIHSYFYANQRTG